MKKFEISITYSKFIEAYDMDSAVESAERIASTSNLTGEYGVFNYSDEFIEVIELKEDE